MAVKTYLLLKEQSTRSVSHCKRNLRILSAGLDPSGRVIPTGTKPLQVFWLAQTRTAAESAVSPGLGCGRAVTWHHRL